MSSIIDYRDRATCVLFGDAAGAVLVEPNEIGYGIMDALIHSDGSGMIHLHQKAGGSRMPPTAETLAKRLHYVHQEGAAVYKFAIAKMAEVSSEIMARNNLRADMIDWLVPHQANKRIIESTAERMGLSMDKVMVTIHKYGNTTNATIPLCLWDYEPKLKRGDRLVLAAFGGGFTWAGSGPTTAQPRRSSRQIKRQRQLGRTISAARLARNRDALRPYRVGAADRSSGSDPRSSLSTGQSSRLYAPPRTAR
jgi:3-oxoacyl-[acyl-carrier-protein] synthase-3